MKILIINGPNLNLLGKRDPHFYGVFSLDEITQMLHNYFYQDLKAQKSDKLFFFQSNHEGALIDFIQKYSAADGLVINPGALTHYSYALSDALRDFPGKKAEAHLTDIKKREAFRAISVTGEACGKVFMGKKERSYLEALQWIVEELKTSIKISN